MSAQFVTEQGDKITTHGVPARYGYIRFASGHHLEYWPVRVSESGYAFLKTADGSRIPSLESRQECIDFIKGHIRKSRIDYLKDFPWDRVSDEFLDEVVAFMNARGFDVIK